MNDEWKLEHKSAPVSVSGQCPLPWRQRIAILFGKPLSFEAKVTIHYTGDDVYLNYIRLEF